jgi:hypothetical protein
MTKAQDVLLVVDDGEFSQSPMIRRPSKSGFDAIFADRGRSL